MKKLLLTYSVVAISAGIILMVGGAWAALFTYQNVTREKIVTPEDASIPNAPVRGPLTLKSQADAIRMHMLTTTGGLTYAEMPRQIAKVDDNGQLVLDKAGKPVMVANEARNMWITATAITTALYLGIITYLFSGLVILSGLISVWAGIVFAVLRKKIS